jgi:hypothetical protein
LFLFKNKYTHLKVIRGENKGAYEELREAAEAAFV